MIDELAWVRSVRPDVRAPSEEARRAARRALDREIARAVRPPASAARGVGRIGGARVRRTLAAAPLAAALVAAVVIAAVAVVLLKHPTTPAPNPAPAVLTSTAGLPPVPQLSPANHRALQYVTQASQSVSVHDKSCARRPPRLFGRANKPDEGSPSAVMLSMFGVLRLPANAGQSLPGMSSFASVFARYVRVAQRRYGSVYEVFPVKALPFGFVTSAACRALELAALRAEVAHVPAQIRARALQLGDDQALDDQYIARHPEGICLVGGCESFLVAQARGELISGGYGNGGSIFGYLVPDGVASITAHYPAEGPKTGYRQHLRALTISVPVINNVAVWRLAFEPGDIFPTTITWRSASGKTLRTVYSG